MALNRRNWLKLLPVTGAASLLGFRSLGQSGGPNCITTDDIVGPFYIPNAPANMQLASAGAAGTVVFITGTVYANDCMTPLKGAEVDVWHASDGGGYEDEDYRGIVETAAGGGYSFQTILPGKYLNGSQFRPRHYHYKVRFEGVELTTQVYFEGDTSIPTDPWASDPSAAERIIPLTPDSAGNLHGVADIYLDVDPPVINKIEDGSQGYQPERSHIKSIYPNPLVQEGAIDIRLSESGKIGLELYDIHGKLMKSIMSQELLVAGDHQLKIDANNETGIKVQPGIYILRLSQNNIPVDAKRFIVAS